MFAALLTLGLACQSVFAAPSSTQRTCSLAKAQLKLPAGQTGLVEPITSVPSYVSFAIGVQNYTCSQAGTYTATGAVAEVYDASCLVGTPLFNSVQDIAYALWKAAPKPVTAQDVIAFGSKLTHTLGGRGFANFILGQHYFVTNPTTGTGVVPKWDFTSSGRTAGNKDAYVIGAKSGGIPAPKGPAHVDWLSLTGTSGKVATQVFRTDTVAGQPPSSCTPGTPDISVKYACKYWFYGSSL